MGIPAVKTAVKTVVQTVPLERVPLQRPSVVESRKRMDVLDFEVVSDTEVPQKSAPQGRVVGRLGRAWIELNRLPEGKSLAIANRDFTHAGYTRRHLQDRAKGVGRRLKVVTANRQDGTGTTLYVRFMTEKEMQEMQE